MDTTLDTLDQIRTTAVDLAVKFGPRVLAASLVLIVGYFIGRWTAQWLERALSHVQIEPPVRSLITRLGRAIVSALFVVIALQNLGVELLPLIAGLGVVGAGIALAMQGVLGNLFAGLTIIFTKPFRVGEYIEIVGEEGNVDTMTLFQTTLLHPDQSRVVIPNRKIVGEILHNFGMRRQLNITVGVAYDSDIGLVLGLIDEILKVNPRVIREPVPLVRVNRLSDSSVDIIVRPWVASADFGPALGEINRAILELFRERGVVFPFPQCEVRLIGEAA
ncbi:small conductance mechanosensitive channel [Povalibacter uvarum]|uniref:Small-conductance mechanosensitive channel n=1 Tax=Povalibacter uvarum TaxID=732238 RepID=A0A841HVP7_9GAMM|nr:mechanosensitive ion channel family protein [Povalibacter uvarum]MBB6096270.1 small conductance mechanosensitive channel [Povalibacter uvarum]